ncbi:hypothetical protein ACFC1D_14245 [Streptomyces vinaceus]|uniref:hypothetical protein n=1 Tax=Streptomyces vinaceus TaxID=1960 RepID=UPI0035DF9E93
MRLRQPDAPEYPFSSPRLTSAFGKALLGQVPPGPRAVVAVMIGARVGRIGFEPVMAWQALPQFEMACVAMLNSPRVRREAPGREGLQAAVARGAELSGEPFKCLAYALADALIGRGLVAGEAPSAEAVARCRDQAGMVPTHGSFDLVGADGQWIWNEGKPADIPVVDGIRLVVLDPPAYRRSWPAGRFFPGMTGELVYDRALEPAESAALLARIAEPAR